MRSPFHKQHEIAPSIAALLTHLGWIALWWSQACRKPQRAAARQRRLVVILVSNCGKNRYGKSRSLSFLRFIYLFIHFSLTRTTTRRGARRLVGDSGSCCPRATSAKRAARESAVHPSVHTRPETTIRHVRGAATETNGRRRRANLRLLTSARSNSCESSLAAARWIAAACFRCRCTASRFTAGPFVTAARPPLDTTLDPARRASKPAHS